MTLKNKNLPFIFSFLILSLFLFFKINGISVNNISLASSGLKLKNPLISFSFEVFILITSFVVPSDLKEKLIFLRWNNPLPGSRAFTELCFKDHRISRNDLVKEYGELPSEPSQQNKLWYKIYKSKQKEPVIKSSHGKWLLFRELVIISLFINPVFIFLTLLNQLNTATIFYSSINLLVIIALWIAAVNSAERFVCNVLAR